MSKGSFRLQLHSEYCKQMQAVDRHSDLVVNSVPVHRTCGSFTRLQTAASALCNLHIGVEFRP